MADIKKPEVQTEPQREQTAVEAKLQKVYNAAMQNAGKNNHNPYIWLRDNYQKLADAIAKGPVTKELGDAVMALPDSPDTRINKSIPDPIAKK